MTESYLQIAANNEDLARDLVEHASARGVTVSTAESLTAGMIASTIADIPGASAVLRGGAVPTAMRSNIAMRRREQERSIG